MIDDHLQDQLHKAGTSEWHQVRENVSLQDILNQMQELTAQRAQRVLQAIEDIDKDIQPRLLELQQDYEICMSLQLNVRS